MGIHATNWTYIMERIEVQLFKAFRTYKEENFKGNKYLSSIEISWEGILFLRGAFTFKQTEKIKGFVNKINKSEDKYYYFITEDLIINKSEFLLKESTGNKILVDVIYQPNCHTYFLETVLLEYVIGSSTISKVIKVCFNLLYNSGITEELYNSYDFNGFIEMMEQDIEDGSGMDVEEQKEYIKNLESEKIKAQIIKYNLFLNRSSTKNNIEDLEELYAKKQNSYYSETLKNIITIAKRINWKEFFENTKSLINIERIVFAYDTDDLPYYTQHNSQLEYSEDQAYIHFDVNISGKEPNLKYANTVVDIFKLTDEIIRLTQITHKQNANRYRKFKQPETIEANNDVGIL